MSHTKGEAKLIGQAFEAWRKLQDNHGWNSPMYCRPDSTPIEIIEGGSTGIHRGFRDVSGFWIADGETWPCACPFLYRPLAKASPSPAKATT